MRVLQILQSHQDCLIDAVNNDGETALSLSVQVHKPVVIKLLLEKDAGPSPFGDRTVGITRQWKDHESTRMLEVRVQKQSLFI